MRKNGELGALPVLHSKRIGGAFAFAHDFASVFPTAPVMKLSETLREALASRTEHVHEWRVLASDDEDQRRLLREFIGTSLYNSNGISRAKLNVMLEAFGKGMFAVALATPDLTSVAGAACCELLRADPADQYVVHIKLIATREDLRGLGIFSSFSPT